MRIERRRQILKWTILSRNFLTPHSFPVFCYFSHKPLLLISPLSWHLWLPFWVYCSLPISCLLLSYTFPGEPFLHYHPLRDSNELLISTTFFTPAEHQVHYWQNRRFLIRVYQREEGMQMKSFYETGSFHETNPLYLRFKMDSPHFKRMCFSFYGSDRWAT